MPNCIQSMMESAKHYMTSSRKTEVCIRFIDGSAPKLTTEQKQLEFELKFQVQNATYKLDDKSAKFYADMHKEKAEKDALLKQQDQAEIERYRKLKNREPETKKEEPKKAITVKRKYQQPREPPLPKRTKPDPKNPLLDGYSSSDED